ncbi:retinol dehydrogenase 8-like [Paramuricea clavata]|uniref:Retinol dehydrogenase 8-like n=1 Tax=Paramuricea clavata TaxID=317549 RepID=A0A7D9LXA1_PARCT|nr:retinol dehydrogenase 8-like [Paramuricea clavata]
MGAFKSLPKRARQSEGDENDCRQQIVLFTGSSEKLAISYGLRLAADPQKRFKVLVAVSSLSSGENLSDTKILKYLNKTLFMLQMDISSQEDVKNVVDRIKEEDGYLDAVGKRA